MTLINSLDALEALLYQDTFADGEYNLNIKNGRIEFSIVKICRLLTSVPPNAWKSLSLSLSDNTPDDLNELFGCLIPLPFLETLDIQPDYRVHDKHLLNLPRLNKWIWRTGSFEKLKEMWITNVFWTKSSLNCFAMAIRCTRSLEDVSITSCKYPKDGLHIIKEAVVNRDVWLDSLSLSLFSYQLDDLTRLKEELFDFSDIISNRMINYNLYISGDRKVMETAGRSFCTSLARSDHLLDAKGKNQPLELDLGPWVDELQYYFPIGDNSAGAVLKI